LDYTAHSGGNSQFEKNREQTLELPVLQEHFREDLDKFGNFTR
jgi:hypothetical protein